MSTTFAYLRVSKTELTVENQRLELESSGHKVDYWFEETISGSVPAFQRPVFSEMISKMRDGETLLISRLDRAGRDCIDIVSTVRTLQQRGIKLVILQLGNVDLTSPVGAMILSVLAAAAELERSLLIERTQSGLARARAQGKKLGRPAKVDSEKQSAIIGLLDSGVSVSQIARDLGMCRNTILKAKKAMAA
jgi:putative DNA-invertase from lambdoid prophage Rac